MTHDEIRDVLPAFALDALDPHERVEVAAHVATCAACTAELAVLGRVVSSVGLEAPPVTPPTELKARVMARVAAERSGRVSVERADQSVRAVSSAPRPWFWNSGLTLAASLTLAVGASIYALSLRTELSAIRESAAISSAQASRLRDELASLRRDRVTLQHIMDVLKAPDTLRVGLKGQAGAPGAAGQAFWSRTAGLMFTADRLPALPAGRVYQLWTITGSIPTSAGTFEPDRSGSASVVASVPAGAPPPDAFGVTIEPAGGSATPTLPIVLIGTAGR